MILRLPPGYRRIENRRPLAVAHEGVYARVERLLTQAPLYEWARDHPERREYRGRGPVYSAPLPDGGPRVVVRHAHRGGLIAPLLRDVYLPPTPAPIELAISSLLRHAGVPTPQVLAFATYRAAFTLRRVDVVTVELDGEDLGAALQGATLPDERRALVPVVAHLVGLLSAIGAWHQDLNVKNILLVRDAEGARRAVVLDVDRVRFAPSGDPHLAEANIQRLRQSMARHTQRTGAAGFDEADVAEMLRIVRADEAGRAADRAVALQEYMP
jgi:hypothetical protein